MKCGEVGTWEIKRMGVHWRSRQMMQRNQVGEEHRRIVGSSKAAGISIMKVPIDAKGGRRISTIAGLAGLKGQRYTRRCLIEALKSSTRDIAAF
jgi:hypothetical protein